MTTQLLKQPRCAALDPTPDGEPSARCTSHSTTRYHVIVGGEPVAVHLCQPHAAELRVDEFKSAA